MWHRADAKIFLNFSEGPGQGDQRKGFGAGAFENRKKSAGVGVLDIGMVLKLVKIQLWMITPAGEAGAAASIERDIKCGIRITEGNPVFHEFGKIVFTGKGVEEQAGKAVGLHALHPGIEQRKVGLALFNIVEQAFAQGLQDLAEGAIGGNMILPGEEIAQQPAGRIILDGEGLSDVESVGATEDTRTKSIPGLEMRKPGNRIGQFPGREMKQVFEDQGGGAASVFSQ